MDKTSYPFLKRNNITHLDASAVFPLHEDVIKSVNHAMESTLGAPGKATYASSVSVTKRTESIRRQIAEFIGADASEIFFTASATDAAKTIASVWANGSVLYSPEDHSRIVMEIAKRSHSTEEVDYLDTGEYDYTALEGKKSGLAIVSSMHHIYGSSNNISTIRTCLPETKLVVDASQLVSRHPIDVKRDNIDALFFSSQKVGGIAGIGVLYIAARHHDSFDLTLIEPNTIPYIPLVSLSAALDVLSGANLNKISLELAGMTTKLISGLQQNPAVSFSKGPAYPDYACFGLGVVSFSVEGYTSQDVAMILEEKGINVRAGDHCVDPNFVQQDVVRISAHLYTTDDDIEELIGIVKSL